MKSECFKTMSQNNGRPIITLLVVKCETVNDPITLAGLKFPNRVGMAAGLDKNARCIDALGAMGFGMASSLRRAGYNVHVFDVRPEVAQRFADGGGIVCASPAEIGAKCDIVVSVVVNAAQTESVLFGDNGAAAAMKPVVGELPAPPAPKPAAGQAPVAAAPSSVATQPSVQGVLQVCRWACWLGSWARSLPLLSDHRWLELAAVHAVQHSQRLPPSSAPLPSRSP